MIREKIIIFCRYPHPGRAKKRLIPRTGADKASLIHQEMVEFTLNMVQLFRQKRKTELEILFTNGQLEDMRSWLGSWLRFSPQVKGDLGDKMSNAFNLAFQQQCDEVVIIGTDCPEITPEILGSAFSGLIEHDVVIGPACDGGYYLIGLKRATPQIFKQVFWGSKHVLQQTIKHCEQHNLSIKALPELHDIDRPEDLILWNKIKRKSRFFPLLSPPTMK